MDLTHSEFWLLLDIPGEKVIATLPCSKLQLKLKTTFVINQTIKHVQPDFIHIQISFCIFTRAVTKTHLLHIKSWVHSHQSLTEVCCYYTGPAEQLHFLELLCRLKLFPDNQNFYCRVISVAWFPRPEMFPPSFINKQYKPAIFILKVFSFLQYLHFS